MALEDHRWAKRQKEEDEQDNAQILQVRSEVCLWAGLAERGFAKTCPVIDQPASAEVQLNMTC